MSNIEVYKQDDALIEVLQSSLYPGADIHSIKMVLGYCRAAALDPMQKPVHIVPMWDQKSSRMRDVVMPGIGLYRIQAARNGCAGISEPEFGPDITESVGGQQITYPAWCRVVVKRRLQTGELAEFAAKELWRENYAAKGGKEKSLAPNSMWSKRPYGQLSKCTEAQALRRAFPEIGSSPTADEVEGKPLNDDFIDTATGEIAPRIATLPDYPAADFEKNLPAWAKIVETGKKTARDLLVMLGTKALFSDEQKAAILSLKPADHDDFVSEMDAAEEAGR